MSEIADFIEGIASDIALQFGDTLRDCKPLAGHIETTDLAAIHANTPAIFISTVGTGELKIIENGQKDIKVFLLAYVLVVNPDSIEREKIAQDLVHGLLCYVPYRRWNKSNAFPANDVESSDLHGLSKGFKPDVTSWRTSVSALSRAADLYGGEDPVSHLALWAVSWEQVLRVGELPSEESPYPPDELVAKHDQDLEPVDVTPSESGAT
ncbi:hypothetical protein [Teredinibacter purpureus]|jgi:hypothetical protein|uniref:hypothetical protein n=1 Tax=Teredinibacter purpureus TaxID=2731756 RepID=UPI0005F83689|nr:hypothetical protein [Teredinibacter purpureus]